MFVTGVQPAGSKGLNSVQGAVIDTTKDASRAAAVDTDRDHGGQPKPGDPQPVVFPREGDTALDQRPVALRQQHAAARYREDGHPERDERGRRR